MRAVSEASTESWPKASAGRGQISLPERARSPWWDEAKIQVRDPEGRRLAEATIGALTNRVVAG